MWARNHASGVFSRRLSGSGGVELSRHVFSDVDPDLIGTGVAENNTLFIQFAELKWDTRDNLLNPTRGIVLSGELDHSSTALISTESFFKLLLEGRHYYALWEKVILASRLTVGGIKPYDGSDSVPSNVRFFAGGPGSIRGYAPNRVGPLDSQEGRSAATACSWGVLSCASRSPAISAAWCSSMPGMSTAAHRPMIWAICVSESGQGFGIIHLSGHSDSTSASR